MMIPKLLSVCALVGLGVVTVAPDFVLKSSDHRKLGKQVAAYWQARTEVDGIQESFLKLTAVVDKIEATLKKKKGPPLLSLVSDWQEIFWNATQSTLTDNKLKKGRVTLDKGADPSFTYWAPKRYSSKKGPAPLLLIIPDAGEDPGDVLDAAWADDAVRGGALLVVVHIEGDPATWSGDAGFGAVMTTFGRVMRSNLFGLDFNRVFLVGQGKGFAAAAATASYFPHLFAGLVGRGDIPMADATNFRNIPTYFGGGGSSAEIQAAIGKLGFENVTTGEDSAGAVWTWMQDQARNASPAHLTFAPPSATARSAGWVKLSGIDMDLSPRVDAVADRDTNTVTVTAEGVSSINLYFNDALVDMDQPVRVIINGGAPHEERMARNARYMVDRVYDYGDWGSVFTAAASFDVPSGN